MKKFVGVLGMFFSLISVIHAMENIDPEQKLLVIQLKEHFAYLDEFNKQKLQVGNERIYYDGKSLRKHFLHEPCIIIKRLKNNERAVLEVLKT